MLNSSSQVDFSLEVLFEAKLISHFLQLVVLSLFDLDLDFVSHSKLVFDVLGTSHAAEDSTSDHDSHLGGQRFSLFHRVGGQNDGRLFVTLRYLLYNLPHEATGFGVHSCRRFIEQNYWWVSDKSHGHGQLSLVAATQSASELVHVVLQVKSLDCFRDNSIEFVRFDSFDQCIEFESLYNSQFGEYRIVLRTVANKLPSILELLFNVIPLNGDLSGSWHNLSRQTLECG